MEENGSAKALLLFSGSLDSQLAACLLRRAGIAIEAVVFTNPFFDGSAALEAAQALDLPLTEIDFTARMVKALQNDAMLDETPADICVACHNAMIREAAERMSDFQCDFIATGEVLNQRTPMQTQEAFEDIETASPLAGWIVRPLSARLLPETLPEKEQWLDRNALLDIAGPGRKQQIEQAALLGLAIPKENGGPTGRLIDPVFAARLRDLRAHEGLQGQRALGLLGIGRHFRLGPVTKLIVGRDENENVALQGQAELYELLIEMGDAPGPVGLLPIIATEDQVRLAASICARYGDVPAGKTSKVRVRSSRGAREVSVVPADEKQVELLRI